jgi:N-acetylmuramoyl-L-alanine amidase
VSCIRHQSGFKFVEGRRASIWCIAAAFCVQFACCSESCAATSGPLRTEVHAIIIHTISGPLCVNGHVVYSGAPGDTARWKKFFDRDPVLGIHYIIDRTGNVASSTPENRTANHAQGNNVGTIGIELVHNGDGKEIFGDAQIGALVNLIRSIRMRYGIAIENIKSHAEVDKRTFQCGGHTEKTRVDPGANFPWSKLRAALTSRSPSEP